MDKQTLLFKTLILSSLMTMSVPSAFSSSLESVSITGQVRFEMRSTLAPDVQCQTATELCERSRPYWSLIVQSGGSQYLFNKAFNVGGKRPPASIGIGGLRLRPGSIVKLDGLAQAQTENFFVLTEVRSVDLVMDSEWICKNVQQTDPQLIAHIGYTQLENQDGAYQIHVEEIEDHATYSIAQIDRAFFKQLSHSPSHGSPDHYEWVFGGTSSKMDITLDISQQSSHFADVPAKLKVARHGLTSSEGTPIVSEIQMTCSQ